MPPLSVPLAAIRQPAFLYDADGRIAEANDLAEALAGRLLARCSAAEIITAFDLRSPDGTPLSPADLPSARALASGEAVDVPLEVTTADGRTVQILASASPVRDGDAVVGALTVWQDVSRLVRDYAGTVAEEMGLQEAKYRRLVDDDITGHVISTPDGRILDCNRAFARMFGFASTEEACSSIIMELYLSPGDREELARPPPTAPAARE